MNALDTLSRLTPAQQAALLTHLRHRRQQAAEPTPELPALQPRPELRHTPFPLTDIQQAYWVGRQSGFELGNVAAHGYLEIAAADLDLPRLEAALNRVIARHDMLRAIVRPDGRQVILADVPRYVIRHDDLADLPTEAREARLAATRDELSHQVLPTDVWPLFDIRVSRLGAAEWRLHLSLDVLIFDAHSFDLISADWQRFYEDPAATLPPLEFSFADYVAGLAELEQTPGYAASLAYWRQRLESLPPGPEFPLARSPETITKPQFVHRSLRLPRADWSALKALAGSRRITPSALLLTVYAAVVGRWAQSPRFTLNLTLFNRLPFHRDVNRLVGDFTSVTLLAVDLSVPQRFTDFARAVQQQLWQDLDHRVVSGVRVLREMTERRRDGQAAQLPVVFTGAINNEGQENEAAAAPAAMAWLGRSVYTITQTPQVWLDCQATEDGGDLLIDWDSVDALFQPGFVDAMFAGCRQLLGHLLAGEDRWNARLYSPDLDLLPSEQHQLRAAANATAAPVPPGLLHQPLLLQCRRQPDALAVADGQRELTFGQLYREANALAHALYSGGLPAGALVGVMLPKSAAQVVAVLGILEAGGAYLPIEPGLPPERITEILRLSGAAALVSNTATLAACRTWGREGENVLERGQFRANLRRVAGLHNESSPENEPFPVHLQPAHPKPDRLLAERPQPAGTLRVLNLDQLAAAEPRPLPAIAGPRDLAYVIYTSGSTGTPKGVAIDHRGALNTCIDCNQRFALTPADRVLGLSALNFDLSVWDIFGVLGAGGALVLPLAERAREPAHWAEQMARYGVTVWNTVPALLDLYVGYRREVAGEADTRLRLAMMSGDWIPLGLPAQIRQWCPQAAIYSLGGATEASIWSIVYPIGEVDPAWRSIPYGKPMLNQSFDVRDHNLNPCPVGVPGELCIGGIGVALGYWRDPERTAAQFPLCPHSGQRLYRTGDLGRWLPDGNLEILGRLDFQVKLNGYRIELGEIEAAMQAVPGVQTAVAHVAGGTAAEGGRLPRQLIGYYIRQAEAPDAEPDGENKGLAALQARLARQGIRRFPVDNGSGDYCGNDPAAAPVPLPGAAPAEPARRSVRHFRPEALPLASLAALLAPLRLAEVNGIARYRYASGGGFYPVQAYLHISPGRVEGLAGGLYYYHPGEHQLRPIAPGQTLQEAWIPSTNRATVAAAAFCVFLVASRQAVEPYYGAEALPTLCLIEAGAICQLLEDTAPPLGLGLTQLGGFQAQRAGDLFRMGDNAYFLQMLAGGLPAAETAPAPASPAAETSDAAFEATLRTHLARRLAEYMVPRQFIRLERLPLSANGKVDRKALPLPQAQRPRRTAVADTLERHPLATEIRALWAEVLRLPQVGLDDSFFDLGGTSVDMIRIHTRLQPRLPRPVTLIDMFFTHPTIGDLVRHLDASAAPPPAPAAPAATAGPEAPRRNRRSRREP